MQEMTPFAEAAEEFWKIPEDYSERRNKKCLKKCNPRITELQLRGGNQK